MWYLWVGVYVLLGAVMVGAVLQIRKKEGRRYKWLDVIGTFLFWPFLLCAAIGYAIMQLGMEDDVHGE